MSYVQNTSLVFILPVIWVIYHDTEGVFICSQKEKHLESGGEYPVESFLRFKPWLYGYRNIHYNRKYINVYRLNSL